MTNNLWNETDFGPCKRECQYAHQPINAQDLCESCYYAQRCPMDGCKNTWHIDGEGLCSLHELETAREEGYAAPLIALWEARVAADETLPTADKVKAAQPDITAAPFSAAWMKSVLGYGRAA